MTATPTTPQPQPGTPWPDPTPIRPRPDVPSGPSYAPGDSASALGDLRGLHLALGAHLASHDDCGPRCADLVYLLSEVGAVLAHTDPTRSRPVLRAVA